MNDERGPPTISWEPLTEMLLSDPTPWDQCESAVGCEAGCRCTKAEEGE